MKVGDLKRLLADVPDHWTFAVDYLDTAGTPDSTKVESVAMDNVDGWCVNFTTVRTLQEVGQ